MNVIEHLKFLKGLKVKADHPITPFNPEETFIIHEAKIENNKLYIRGEKTIWWHSSLITRIGDL